MVITRPLLVIIVDDEASVGFLSRMKFRHAIADGTIELHFFESARDCLHFLHKIKDDDNEVILFTDINMPSFSGYDLLTEIKSQYPTIPVYMMSAYDDAEAVKKSEGLGAKGYFTKPVDFSEVKSLIRSNFGLAV
ncbi:Nitrogen regulation protein NR(I) [compost metagenome]